MAIISTFTRNDNGLQGTVKTFTLKAKVRFVPLDRTSDASPDFRIVADTDVGLGAAWKKGNAFTSVKLDDPSFAKPIFASLVEAESGVRPSDPSVLRRRH